MILLLCGIPGSGKSTIAERLAARLAVLGSVHLLSSDKLKPPVYRKLFRAVAANRKRADFLILDATFYKKEWRQQVKVLAGGEEVLTVYLDCSLEVALRRNKERQPNISETAVHIIFHQMDPPKTPSLRIDTVATTADEAAGSIFELAKNQWRARSEAEFS